jgi:hypothetical protein
MTEGEDVRCATLFGCGTSAYYGRLNRNRNLNGANPSIPQDRLSSGTGVQECDATMLNISNTVWTKNLYSNEVPSKDTLPLNNKLR